MVGLNCVRALPEPITVASICRTIPVRDRQLLVLCSRLAPFVRQCVAAFPEDLMRQKPYLTVVSVVLLLTALGFAQAKKTSTKPASSGPDKAHLQKIWDGWATLDPSKVAEYYAPGQHTFFDIAPLKYSSWDEYQKGVVNVLADFKTAKFTVNDDAELHPAGQYVWATSTVKEDATMKSGKRDMATFRWTVVFEKQDGKWLIVHEHISEPLQ
jgi:ketosteroid isomerase-like protein